MQANSIVALCMLYRPYLAVTRDYSPYKPGQKVQFWWQMHTYYFVAVYLCYQNHVACTIRTS